MSAPPVETRPNRPVAQALRLGTAILFFVWLPCDYLTTQGAPALIIAPQMSKVGVESWPARFFAFFLAAVASKPRVRHSRVLPCAG